VSPTKEAIERLREGLAHIVSMDSVGLMVKAEDLAALLASHDKLVEGLRWSVTELEEWDQYQRHSSRGEWGVECACCMGEMFEKNDLERITGLRALLKELEQ